MAAEVVLVPALQQPNNSGQVRVTDATEWCSRPLHVPVTGRADGEGMLHACWLSIQSRRDGVDASTFCVKILLSRTRRTRPRTRTSFKPCRRLATIACGRPKREDKRSKPQAMYVE